MFRFKKFSKLSSVSIDKNGFELNSSALPLNILENTNSVVELSAVKSGAIKNKILYIAPVLISVVLSVIGQIVLKRGMSDLGPISLSGESIFKIFFSIALDPFVIVGAVIYAGSVLCWLIGLSRVQLSYAYPFLSLSYVVILAASYFILGEQISILRLGGVGIICAGVVLVASS